MKRLRIDSDTTIEVISYRKTPDNLPIYNLYVGGQAFLSSHNKRWIMSKCDIVEKLRLLCRKGYVQVKLKDGDVSQKYVEIWRDSDVSTTSFQNICEVDYRGIITYRPGRSTAFWITVPAGEFYYGSASTPDFYVRLKNLKSLLTPTTD